jgi:hypothetical protein
MYGGELALWLYFDAMAFTDDRAESWKADQDALRARSASLSTGVGGAVEQVMGERHDGVMSSVYAEIAHRHAWLVLDRELSAREYGRLRDTFRDSTTHDRTHSDVVAAFGPPSMLLGGSNPYYSKTLAYGTARPDDPLVFFHLWNGSEPGAERTWPPVHAEPLLLAARCGGASFADGFSFTPKGAARREQLR